MTRYASILDTIGNTPLVRLNKLAPEGVNVYVKIEAFNPMGSVKDRMARAVIERGGANRRVAARADGHRGHERQHRHRPRDGVCTERLSARRHDGRELQRRAAQAAALPGREGRADARSEKGSGMLAKAVELARDARLVPVPAVRERSERRRAFAHDRAGNPRGLRGRAAGLLGDGLWHRRHAQGRGAGTAQRAAGRRRSSPPSPTTRQVLGSGIPQRRDAAGKPTAEPSAVPAASDAGLGAGLHLAS